MPRILFFDTETTGLPDWKQPSEAPHQPHIVELAAELVDSDSREVIETLDVLVRPDGWEISPEMAAIHGITHEEAAAHGIPEREAVERLLLMRAKASLRVAHNKTFDDRIVRIALKRYFDDLTAAPEVAQPSDVWKDGESFCTCYGSKKLCALPGNKLPTLAEAHARLLAVEPERLHRALPDTQSCRAIYFALQDLQPA